MKIINEGITFDDVMIVPNKSTVDINDISTKVKLTNNITLNTPLVSSPIEAVTKSKMAIAVARQGGIGIIRSGLTIEEQVTEVDKVKRSEHGVIIDPFSLSPNNYVYEANELMGKYHISGVPITEDGYFVGIITNRDLKFEKDHKKKIYEVMTRENLVTAKVGTTLEEAKKILSEAKVEKLPLLDDDGFLKGLITIKDIEKVIKYPSSAKDENNRLLCGACIALNEFSMERVDKLVEAGVDLIYIKNYHGHDEKLKSAVEDVREKYKDLDIMAGTVVTASGCEFLIKAGANIVVVGLGAGSLDTTRVVSGVGVPQITAIMDCYDVAKNYNVSIVSEGGIKHLGDITKSLAAGASAVMLGGTFAGCDESPSEIELYEGKKYKVYKRNSLVPVLSTLEQKQYTRKNKKLEIFDSIEGRISYKGSLRDTIAQIVGSLKLGMKYSGAKDMDELKNNCKFIKVSKASNDESHPYNVQIIKERKKEKRSIVTKKEEMKKN